MLTLNFFKNIAAGANTAYDVKNAFNGCKYCNIIEESYNGDNVEFVYFGSDEVKSSEVGNFVISLDNGSKMIVDGEEFPCYEDCRVTIFENEYEGESLFTYTITACDTGETL